MPESTDHEMPAATVAANEIDILINSLTRDGDIILERGHIGTLAKAKLALLAIPTWLDSQGALAGKSVAFVVPKNDDDHQSHHPLVDYEPLMEAQKNVLDAAVTWQAEDGKPGNQTDAAEDLWEAVEQLHKARKQAGISS